MKRILIALTITFIAHIILAQPTYQDRRDNTQLWGEHDISALKTAPFKEWYTKSTEDYKPDLSYFTQANNLKDAEVTIYLGTWCGDSKKWVPKFLKLWDELGLSQSQLNLISLSNSEGHYKKGPKGEEKGQNIHKVPTFIFSRDNEEIGRIVERPRNSLEIDVAQIGLGMPSEARYRAVSIINDYFSNHTEPDSSYTIDADLIYRKISREVTRPGELNSYGYLLLWDGQKEKAEFVFLLNSYLFKDTPNCHDSLGEVYMELEKWEDAQECFYKVLASNPKDERVIQMLYKINEAIAEGS